MDPSSSTDLPAARLRDATRRYRIGTVDVVALDSVNLDIHAGDLTAIVGPSGSGKSTLLHCLAGLERLTSGHAFLGAEDLASTPEPARTRIRRSTVGVIFQRLRLHPGFTVADNIRLPLRIAGLDDDPAWIRSLVERFELGDRLGHRPAELSGGQQQAVAAARALVTKPALVLADEPTGNLDLGASARLIDFLRAAVDDLGQTVVVATHDPRAAAAADRVVGLLDGRIARDVEHPAWDEIVDLTSGLVVFNGRTGRAPSA